MEDRFKFRVWIEKYKKLVDVYRYGNDEGVCQWIWHSHIYDTPDGKPVIDNWGSVDERFSNIIEKTKLIDCILEQCTGLKDKNGKLIYEGDILFVKTLDWKKKERWDAEEVKTYWSVEYKSYLNHCGFMVFGINRRFHKPLSRTVIFNSEAEVIGNIHENPELLKESK